MPFSRCSHNDTAPFHYNKATPTIAPATMIITSHPNLTTPASLIAPEEEAAAAEEAAVGVAEVDNAVPLTVEVSKVILPVPTAATELNVAFTVVVPSFAVEEVVELHFLDPFPLPVALPVAVDKAEATLVQLPMTVA